MTNLWINEYQNWNALYTPYISHSLRMQKIFLLHAVWYEDRAFQLLKFSMSQEVKKGPFAALSFGFIYQLPKILHWAKFEGKLCSDAKCLWTALTEIASYYENKQINLLPWFFCSCPWSEFIRFPRLALKLTGLPLIHIWRWRIFPCSCWIVSRSFHAKGNVNEKGLSAYIRLTAPQIKDCPALGLIKTLHKSANDKRTNLISNW